MLWTATIYAAVWNNPHQGVNLQNTRYSPIVEPPKTLDPARSYSADEHVIIAQIYEPPLQYHYLKRPYVLVPLTASIMPQVTYYDARGKKLAVNADPHQIAHSVYDIYIKSGINYQPHPALAKDNNGQYINLNLTRKALWHIHVLSDFKQTGTRELTADDYVYEIKRLASPKVQSPIFGLMSKYIQGFPAYSNQLQAAQKQNNSSFLDLRQYPLAGVKVIDRYHYQIIINGVYSEFEYWLAMMFFSPIPWEADAFYSQPGLIKKNITLDSYPIGTGPYLLAANNPNKEIVLVRNPNFHGETYPTEGEKTDKENGYLEDAGKPMPFIDRAVFVLDKESIPRWNKFLQGYYDKSGISPEGFDYAIKIDPYGKPYLTPGFKKLGVRLQTIVAPGIYYMGFNMLDPVVGGYGEKQQKLRQAIAIALDEEEFISIFMNGRGVPAQGPIPPGIFGYKNGAAGINPYMYTWTNGKPQRLSIAYAQRLLAEAGYPGGIDPHTHKPLILNYDVATVGSPDDKAQFDWLRKQFAKLGIQLNIRATLYSRFRDRVQTGQAQIFSWGWLADYPDPENFLFLLYSANGKVKYGGENSANYSNPQFDRLFEEMRNLPNGPLRQEKIDELLAIVRKDSPWIWGFYPIDFGLSHQWNRVSKPNGIAVNTLKYERLDVVKRAELRKKWNQPVIWPFMIFIAALILIFVPLMVSYWRREHRPTSKKMDD
jgi:ABC-type transport system substrate-binding protein